MNGLFRNRYGIDKLNLILLAISIILIFTRITYLSLLGLALFALIIFRATSRNFTKRQMELSKFNYYLSKVNNFFDRLFRPLVRYINNAKQKRDLKKVYKYVKCRYCGKKMRVPRNKGKIKITCPECKNQFITKT